MTGERLVFTPFGELNDREKKIIGDSWNNPFNARYNKMDDPYGDVEEISTYNEPTFSDFSDYRDCMYFRVVRDRESGKIIGTCRFGKYYPAENNETWDFGFNILLKYWGKGFGIEVLKVIIEFARDNGVKTIIGGADKENFGSYKAMIKNGFEYDCIDQDGDYRYILDLTKSPKTEDEISKVWDNHIMMTKKDFGDAKFEILNIINKKIKEMVERINEGEDEDELVNKYFQELNAIDEFVFS